MSRSVFLDDEGSIEPQLIIGFTPGYIATLHARSDTAVVELNDHPAKLTVVGRQSIVDYLRERAPAERP